MRHGGCSWAKGGVCDPTSWVACAYPALPLESVPSHFFSGSMPLSLTPTSRNQSSTSSQCSVRSLFRVMALGLRINQTRRSMTSFFPMGLTYVIRWDVQRNPHPADDTHRHARRFWVRQVQDGEEVRGQGRGGTLAHGQVWMCEWWAWSVSYAFGCCRQEGGLCPVVPK